MSPVKEPHYFTFEGAVPIFAGPKGDHFRRISLRKPSDYLCLFAGATSQKAIGEASTTYLKSPVAAERLRRFMPDAKIVVLLRQPVERGYSHYNYLKAQGVEQAASFAEAIEQEDRRKADGWFFGHLYREGGCYAPQLKRYYELFPRDQIRVILYEDWNNSPQTVLGELFEFLGVDAGFVPEIRRNNVTLLPSCRWFDRLARRAAMANSQVWQLVPAALRKAVASCLQAANSRYNLYAPPSLDPELLIRMTEAYSEDIFELQHIIGRNLSQWLHPGENR